MVAKKKKTDFLEDIIRQGASVGLRPQDIYEMELWEFNNYIIGYKDKTVRDEKNIMKIAWNTAILSRMKKPKSLESYLLDIDREMKPDTNKDRVPVDKKRNQEIEEAIKMARLKKESR